MWFLGMDVGTGGTRAVVVDGAGKLIAGALSEHAAFKTAHPGWAEQNPQDWWRAAQEAIRGALAAAPEPRQPIAAIGLTGQMHGAVLLDENGQVLRPSLIWCDTRTQQECDWLTERIGYERLIELTCNPALPNFTLTKLLWVKKHEPEIFAKIHHIMCPKDYVRYRLTGREQSSMIPIYGRLEGDLDEGGQYNPHWLDWSSLIGVPADIPVVGYGGRCVNFLRLYTARAPAEFDMAIFNDGDYLRAMERQVAVETVSKVLYPSDSAEAGRELRFIQEYFFVACAMRDIFRRHSCAGHRVDEFGQYNAIQLNDTHPALAVVELMRTLVDEHCLSWDTAWEIRSEEHTSELQSLRHLVC